MNGVNAVYTVTMASAGTLSTEAKLLRSYKTAYLVIPTMTSNTQLHIQGSEQSGGTFRRVYFPMGNTAAPIGNAFAIGSACTGCIVPIPNGIQYLKVEATATVNDGAFFKIICSD